jgi:hypothetical protein
MPNWTQNEQDRRNDGRPARLAALYILKQRHELPDIPNTQLAKRLGISRWTLDRDLASVDEIDALVNAMIDTIKA